VKYLYYFIPPTNPSGYTQQGGPASAAIAGQMGKMLQMQLLETNNNINAIKEGAEQPFFLANGILYISTTGGATFTYGNRAPSYDGYLREVVVSGSRSGSNSNRFQFKSVSNANYQLDFGGRGGGSYTDISNPKVYPGISIYETNQISGGVTIPGVGIFVDNRNDKALLQHEYGHYLNYQYWKLTWGSVIAGATYHTFISAPSIINMGFDKALGTHTHADFFTESWADQFAKNYFGSSYVGYKDSRFSTYGK